MTTTNISFEVTIEGGHQALVDDPPGEIKRMLKDITHALDAGRENGVLRDINGNRVGEWTLDVEDEDEDEDEE